MFSLASFIEKKFVQPWDIKLSAKLVVEPLIFNTLFSLIFYSLLQIWVLETVTCLYSAWENFLRAAAIFRNVWGVYTFLRGTPSVISAEHWASGIVHLLWGFFVGFFFLLLFSVTMLYFIHAIFSLLSIDPLFQPLYFHVLGVFFSFHNLFLPCRSSETGAKVVTSYIALSWGNRLVAAYLTPK